LFFFQKANRRIVERLGQAGLNMRAETGAGLKPLAGRQFVLTGALETMTRAEAKARIEALGGRVTSAVTKKTDYVVVGADPGSKAEKATALKRTTLSEDEFTALLTGG